MSTPSTSGTTVSGRRLRLNVGHDSWDVIWSHVHRVLVVNLGVAVTNLPLLLALATEHQPWRYPVFFGLLSLGAGPSLAAVFAYLRRTADDERAPVAALFRGYRRLFTRALLGWTPFVLLIAVAATDLVALWGSALGPALAPLLIVLMLLALSSGVVAMAGLAEDPRLSRRTLLTACYASVRRWPLALLNLGLLGVSLALVNQAPLMGLAVVPGCALFVVWRDCGAMLEAVGGVGTARPPDATGRRCG
ncbi:YesL family protein [Streptomyces sp. ME19-01-6]|uniref:YesL family protein n=1 Tax=Streptomyces sp. ME19-01-6 TaxID=3028686 RepID=UPI0029BB3734|nr:YesL family protein [Streptomyces sp. ME19-01-6]MDX3231076.1 YesL family protein [Streptomyces sp. ME19-01-6]